MSGSTAKEKVYTFAVRTTKDGLRIVGTRDDARPSKYVIGKGYRSDYRHLKHRIQTATRGNKIHLKLDAREAAVLAGQIVEGLRTRVAELEAEVERLSDELHPS